MPEPYRYRCPCGWDVLLEVGEDLKRCEGCHKWYGLYVVVSEKQMMKLKLEEPNA